MKTKHAIIINQEKCIKCNKCVKDCPMMVIEMQERGAALKTQKCMKCGHCFAVCPSGCISMEGFEDVSIKVTENMKVDADDLLNHIKTRRSIREFTDEKIDKATVRKLIEAGQYAPTARNYQGVSYSILMKNIDKYEEIAVAKLEILKNGVSKFTNKLDGFDTENFFFKKAPLVIVIKANNDIDGAIAAANIELMAHALNLGCFYSGMFTVATKISPKLKKMLRVSKKDKVVTTLVIGYPKVKYLRTVQKERPTVFMD